jgi:hypothetical protein
MIFYLVTSKGQSTIREYLRTVGRPLAGIIGVIPYEQLRLMRSLPVGVYLFSDIERLGGEEAETAAEAWQALSAAGVRVLNHPTRSLRRYELLRTLHDRGINQHDVRRVIDLRRTDRFPVFIRRENDHNGTLSALLATQSELDAELARLEREGCYRDDLIITEFCDTAGADGVVRKYSAFRVADRIVPRHVLFSRRWHVKIVELVEPAYVAEELAYVETNPHQRELREIFDLARIEFGRIDYGLRDGRIQVWEINTNPILGTFDDGGMPARAPVIASVTPPFADALRALNATAPERGPRIVLDAQPRGEFLKRRLRPLVDAVEHALGVEGYDAALSRFLGRARRLVFGDPHASRTVGNAVSRRKADQPPDPRAPRAITDGASRGEPAQAPRTSARAGEPR